MSLVEARSEIFFICRFVNVPCCEVSLETSFVRAAFPAACFLLFLVLGVDVSAIVTSAALIVVVMVDEEEEELVVVVVVSSFMIMRRFDGVVVGDGASDMSDGREKSDGRIYSRLFISMSRHPFATSRSPDKNNLDPRRNFFVLE